MPRRLPPVAWLSALASLLAAPAARPADAPAPAPRQALPLQSMAPAAREKVRAVVEKPTLATRGRPQVFAGPPQLYQWLLDHPDRAALAWQRLGAPPMPIADGGDGHFTWKEAQGTDVRWDLAHADGAMRVWYAEGKVRPAALLPLVPFQAVVVLRHAEAPGTEGKTLVRHQAELFLQTDGKTASLVTRLLGASAPRMAEEYVGQLQMFFGTLTWYVAQHPERAAALLAEATTAPGARR